MKSKTKSISIRKFPPEVTGARSRDLVKDLGSSLNVDRPAVVLDCSDLRALDAFGVHLLLCCLEEAIKRNGDIRLAALRPEVRGVLKSVEVDSLFQCFESVGEAVESFHNVQIQFPTADLPVARGSSESGMNAA